MRRCTHRKGRTRLDFFFLGRPQGVRKKKRYFYRENIGFITKNIIKFFFFLLAFVEPSLCAFAQSLPFAMCYGFHHYQNE